MHIGKLSLGHIPNCGVLIIIILQSFLLLLLQTFEANGEKTVIESCQTEIYWKPIHYYIRISTDIHKNETSFRGKVGIDGVVLEDTNELLIHSKLIITEAFYTIEAQRYEIDLKLARETKDGVLTLYLNQTLIKDQHFRLTIEYNGNMNTKPGISVAYHKSQNGPRPVVSTELHIKGARRVFPCLDEPRFKAKFSIEVARPQSMVALSNMELIKTSLPDPDVDNQVWDSFQPTPVMSTYLVAVLICDDYINISLPRNSSFWIPRESKDAVYLASVESNRILNSLETFTGINYTLSKLDFALVPERSKDLFGTENWGLITWSYRYFELASKNVSLISESGAPFYVALAHEIVHQWFGNLVTSRYWCYHWLNEGLSTFMMNHIVNQVFPLIKANELFTLGDVNYVMVLEPEQPMKLFIEDKCCREEMFMSEKSILSVLSVKGAAITTMLESNILSNETFRIGIQRYLKNNMYGTVTNKELWGAFQEVMEETSIGTIPEGTTLETVMDTWTHNGGFPILHMYRFENGSVAVRQEEFVSYEEDITNVSWWIPLTYTTTSKNDFSRLRVQEWLSPSGDLKILETNISENEWIIFNTQQKGYYKVNYDLKTWELITDHLMNGNIDDIHPINRALLLKDAFMLAERGFINYSVALNLSKYLVRENNYFPLKAGEDVISNLLDSFRGNRTSYHKFMEYYRFVFGGIYQNVRLGRYNVTDLPSSWLKLLAIRNSCGSKMDHCGQQALQTAEFIIDQKIQEDQIDPLLSYELWCNAVKLGGNRVFDYVKNKYLNEKDEMVKNTLLDSLFCADSEKIPSLIKENLLTVDYFKDNLSMYLFSLIFVKESAFCPTVNYINDHYDIVVSSIGEPLKSVFDSLGSLPPDEECNNKTVEMISKLYNAAHTPSAAAIVVENEKISKITSWLDEQNLTAEVYSEENDTFSTAPNLFLRQDEFSIFME